MQPSLMLIAKQLVHYGLPFGCHQCLSWAPPGVWDAILATELPLDDPLAVAPVYWQQFVLH